MVLCKSGFSSCFVSQELMLTEDGNGQNFFCALHLVTTTQASEDQKPFPQSARSRCLRPLMIETNNHVVGAVNWNEVFIFEVPHQVLFATINFSACNLIMPNSISGQFFVLYFLLVQYSCHVHSLVTLVILSYFVFGSISLYFASDYEMVLV